MEAVNTVILNINLSVKSGLLPVTLKGDGIAERPDKSYIKLSLFTQNYEILSLGPDQVYVKPLGASDWELTSQEQMDLMTSLLKNPFDLLEVSDYAISPLLASFEEINGVNCQKVTMGIDLPLYLSRHAPSASSQIDLVTSQAQADIWIGVDDHRIHRQYFKINIISQGEALPLDVWIDLIGYNEPIVLPTPPINQ